MQDDRNCNETPIFLPDFFTLPIEGYSNENHDCRETSETNLLDCLPNLFKNLGNNDENENYCEQSNLFSSNNENNLYNPDVELKTTLHLYSNNINSICQEDDNISQLSNKILINENGNGLISNNTNNITGNINNINNENIENVENIENIENIDNIDSIENDDNSFSPNFSNCKNSHKKLEQLQEECPSTNFNFKIKIPLKPFLNPIKNGKNEDSANRITNDNNNSDVCISPISSGPEEQVQNDSNSNFNFNINLNLKKPIFKLNNGQTKEIESNNPEIKYSQPRNLINTINHLANSKHSNHSKHTKHLKNLENLIKSQNPENPENAVNPENPVIPKIAEIPKREAKLMKKMYKYNQHENHENQGKQENQLPKNTEIRNDSRLRIQGRFIKPSQIFSFLGISVEEFLENPVIQNIIQNKNSDNYSIQAKINNTFILRNMQSLFKKIKIKVPSFSLLLQNLDSPKLLIKVISKNKEEKLINLEIQINNKRVKTTQDDEELANHNFKKYKLLEDMKMFSIQRYDLCFKLNYYSHLFHHKVQKQIN